MRTRDVLHEILENLSSRKHIHNWDDKIVTSPFAALAVLARGYLNENPPHLDSLLEDAVVDEVFTVGGVSRRPAVKKKEGGIDTYLFFAKKFSDEESTSKSTPGLTGSSAQNDNNTLLLSQGRIVYIKEEISPLQRASLLILHSFCIRLQSEDYGFIRTFIERHLSLRCVQKIPYHWQQTSPPEIDASSQKCYKRVTLSCHIAYLTLKLQSTTSKDGVLNRTALFSLKHEKGKNSPIGLSVFKASSSVLLTLVFPTESQSREEATNLLRNPQALWSVLVVNCPSDLASDHGPPEYLTPTSQYIRGVTTALATQRINAQTIYEAIRLELDRCEGDSLFDDEHFTKSTLFHRTVHACNELAESISSSLRFVRNMLDTQIKKLSRESHAYEKFGVQFWMQRIDEEILASEDVQAQIVVLRAQVQEKRQALHGVTAILESRLALQQSDRMKSLAYLATIYLPLTCTASLYSMSVLPSSATFASFFVVFGISLLITILLGLNLSTLRTRISLLTQVMSLPTRFPLRISKPTEKHGRHWVSDIKYIQGYLNILNPNFGLDDDLLSLAEIWGEKAQSSWPFLIIWLIIRHFPIIVLHIFLAHEVNFPFYQWFLYQNRNHPQLEIYYHWAFFVRDFFRFILLPAWVVLGA